MKKLAITLAAGLLIFGLTACRPNINAEGVVNFYYPRAEYTSGEADSVFYPEPRELSEDDLQKLLSIYLRGPEDSALTNPFPAGTELVRTEQSGNRLFITLSDEFASLSGVNLSVACCSLTQTVLALTDSEVVEISTHSGMLDGKQSVIMDRNSVSLVDDSHTVLQPEPND